MATALWAVPLDGYRVDVKCLCALEAPIGIARPFSLKRIDVTLCSLSADGC